MNNILKVTLSLSALTLAFSSTVYADDISAFKVPESKPKILLVLDYSNSMKRKLDDSNVSRLDTLRQSVTDLVNDTGSKAEFGFGPIFGGSASGVLWPISDLTEDASAVDPRITDNDVTGLDVVSSLLNDHDTTLGTATVSGLLEAARYFRGESVEQGGIDPRNTEHYAPIQWDDVNNSYTTRTLLSTNSASYRPSDAYEFGVSPGSTAFCTDVHWRDGGNQCNTLATNACIGDVCDYTTSDRWQGAQYESPIDNECQSSHIVLVSDGRPATRSTYPGYTAFEDITGLPTSSCDDLAATGLPESNRISGMCGKEVARFLANNDQIASVPNSKVTTHAIGFDLDTFGARYLREIATEGKGIYRDAKSAAELNEALSRIVNASIVEQGQFVNFSVDINRASLSHDNRVYLPLFKPDASPSWLGNLKGYFLGDGGLEDINGDPAIESTLVGPKFVGTAQSFWSDQIDGASITDGGATSKLDPANRKLYTFNDNPNNVPLNGISLKNNADHHLTAANTSLDDSLFGVTNQREVLLDWLRQQPMGSPMHSNALIANYEHDQRVVFTSSNQGFLHAIDATYPQAQGDVTGGNELFAFMPADLLSNIRYLRGDRFHGEHIYGLDGQIVPWHTDNNKDGIVNGSDTLMLVIGMRRGGSNYYALDVTDPNNPKFKWQITGGVGGFNKLAQTWSKPALVTVYKDASKAKQRVMIFGGGYDDAVDDIYASTASSGNSIYMVDENGNLIWSANHANMDYAIPSDIRTIDTDNDGVTDRLYVGDLGSQIWRVDFTNIANPNNFSTAVFADLSAPATPTINLNNPKYRPFFYPPSVSVMSDSARSPYLISIGSGNRDNPVRDMSTSFLYVLEDHNREVGPQPTGTQVLKPVDLFNASNVAAISQQDQDLYKGWLIELDNGEKVLAEVKTLEGTMFATTYKPNLGAAITDACAAAPSHSRIYAVGLEDASAAIESEAAGNETSSTDSYLIINRHKDVPGPGILSSANFIFTADSSNIDVYVGNEKEAEITPSLNTIFWFNE